MAATAGVVMVLVDTTVWVDFLSGHPLPQVKVLDDLISEEEDICICGVILTEVLQGIRKDQDYKKTKRYFESLIYLPMTRSTFVAAADMYRSLRKQGVTIRKPIDCMIASVGVEQNTPLLHNDRDFDALEERCGLKVVKGR